MVIDDTGLAGTYYFATEFAQENHPPEVDLPSIFGAIREDMGLKLEKRKVDVEMLVVDRIDRIPSEKLTARVPNGEQMPGLARIISSNALR
jgi:uncharacterized protein (TIGR03435 family)